MKIENIETVRVYIDNDRYCDATPAETMGYYNFWLYHRGYGVGVYMFGISTSPEDIPVLVRRNAPDYIANLIDLIRGTETAHKYFCSECGNRFSVTIPYVNEHGFDNKPYCPRCGDLCTFPDTERGRADSIRISTNYENEQRILYDEE